MGLRGRPDDEDEGQRQGLYYPWDQDSLGVAGPLDNVSLQDLQQRFITVVRVKPELATPHAKLITHSFGLVNHALGVHRPNGSENTPNSLLRAIKLWYILPALLHSQDGRMKRTMRFQAAERGDLTTLIPWLMEYTGRAATRLRGPAHEATEEAKFERASSACRHQGGVTVAARGLLAEPRAPGNEVTWAIVREKFPAEDRASVSAAAAAAVAASATEPEDGSGPAWRPEGEFDPQVAFEVINSRNALSGAGSDGLRFSHLQSIIRTGFGRENFGTGIEAFWRRIVDDPDAFPSEFWELFLQSNLTALGEKCRPVCVGMTWRRLLAAGTMRQWRPRMEELNIEARQYGVGVAGGVEHVALRARVHHEAGNWVIQTDASNAFNSILRKPMLEQVASCTPALTGFVAKCYGERPAPVFFQMESGERTKLECSRGVQQGDAMGPALFCLPLRPVLMKVREEYEQQGVEAFAYLDDISVALQEITPSTVEVVTCIERELLERGVKLNPGKTVALAPKGHVPTQEEISLLASVGVRIEDEGGIKVVGVPVGTDAFATETAIGIVREGGAEQLARMLPRMPDKQSANLIATGSMVQRTAYIERGVDPKMSQSACQRADNGALWMLENLLELPGTAEESTFFEEGCPADRLTMLPHQRAQARLSTGAGGFGLSSAEARRMSASVGSLVATLPAVLADLTGILGEKVRNHLPGSDLVNGIWDSVRGLRDDLGVSEEAMSGVVPESWRDRAFRAEEGSVTEGSEREVLGAHDAETINSNKAQQRLGKLVNRVRYEKYAASLEELPIRAQPLGESGPFGETETRDCAKARQRSQCGPGAAAWLRARPVDASRVVPAQEFLYAGRRYLGIEEHLATTCPCCGAAEANTRHARLCHRAGAQVNQHQPLVHAASRFLKRVSVRHQVESGAPFNADRDLRMDIVIERGGLRDATAPEFRCKGILLDVTYADPQAGVHLNAGSADRDGLAASTSEARKRTHYARPGHVSFDERSHKLVTLAVESFGRLGQEGSEFIDQLAASVVGGRDGGSQAKKGICKERLLQIISVTAQVAISRRVHRYKLAMRDRQAARGRREEAGGLCPMAWGRHIDAE